MFIFLLILSIILCLQSCLQAVSFFLFQFFYFSFACFCYLYRVQNSQLANWAPVRNLSGLLWFSVSQVCVLVLVSRPLFKHLGLMSDFEAFSYSILSRTELDGFKVFDQDQSRLSQLCNNMIMKESSCFHFTLCLTFQKHSFLFILPVNTLRYSYWCDAVYFIRTGDE